MTEKRPIAAISLPDLKPGTIPTALPEVTWLKPTDLLVDQAYQRNVGEKGQRLIRRVVEGFDWRRFKPPTCVWTDAGLEVIDGQHSAIAAATHPEVDTIPVVIVDAARVEDRAGAFLGMNRDRLGITPMALHAAAVVAGDNSAVAIERVCAAAGVTILRMPPSNGSYKPKQTVAVRAIGDMVKRVGEDLAVIVLAVLADANMAPITANALRAAEAILVAEEYGGQVDAAELTRAIVALGTEADKEAGVFAATHCVPRWRGLVSVWFRKAKKRKPKADEATPPPAEGASDTTPNVTQPAEKSAGRRAKGVEPSPPPQTAEERRASRHYTPFRNGTHA